MGSKALPRFGAKPLETLGMDNVISQTIAACTQLSTTKTGALIVFERSVTLDEQMRSGTTINSDVTAELLKNIFYPKAPLHDGAVVIRDGRIAEQGTHDQLLAANGAYAGLYHTQNLGEYHG